MFSRLLTILYIITEPSHTIIQITHRQKDTDE